MVTRSLDTSLDPEPGASELAPVHGPAGGSVHGYIGLGLLGEGNVEASGPSDPLIRPQETPILPPPKSSNRPPPTLGFRDQTGCKLAAPFPAPPLRPRWLCVWFSAGGRTGERSRARDQTPVGGPEADPGFEPDPEIWGAALASPGSQARDPPGRDLNWSGQHRVIAQKEGGLSLGLFLCPLCLPDCLSLSVAS